MTPSVITEQEVGGELAQAAYAEMFALQVQFSWDIDNQGGICKESLDELSILHIPSVAVHASSNAT